MSSSGRSGTLLMLVTSSSCNGSAATAPAGELSPVCLSSWSSSRCSNPVTRGRSLDARREHDQGHVGGGILPSVRRSRTPPPAGRRPHVGGGIPPALRDSRTPPLARGAARPLSSALTTLNPTAGPSIASHYATQQNHVGRVDLEPVLVSPHFVVRLGLVIYIYMERHRLRTTWSQLHSNDPVSATKHGSRQLSRFKHRWRLFHIRQSWRVDWVCQE